MAEHASIGLAEALTLGVRVGHGHADHEHEGRLDHVPRGAADPLDVREVVADLLPGFAGPGVGRAVVVVSLCECGQAETTGDHQQHGEAAEGVEGHESGRRLDEGGGD